MLGYKRDFWPTTVYVTRDACDDQLTQRVLSRIPQVEVVDIDGRADPLTELGFGQELASDAEVFSAGKRQLLLTRQLGTWLKNCPGTSQHVCCNLWVASPGEGCPLDCTYCYLQHYFLRNPTMKLFTNTADMLTEIKTKAESEKSRVFRICTGEFMDSLVWDDLTDLSLELVPFFAKIPNIILELKSKSNFIDNLLAVSNEHEGKTVVSWSVNAAKICESDEAWTSSLDERIEAAAKVSEVGYRVGFHFDPVIHFDGWQESYQGTIRRIFERVDYRHIAWVSVSLLRYHPEMQRTMIERFPDSSIPFGEQFLAKDNKLRYIQPLRFKMIKFIRDELKAVNPDMAVYMCMESSAAWRYLTGGPPVAGAELSEVFSRRGRLPIVSVPQAAPVVLEEQEKT